MSEFSSVLGPFDRSIPWVPSIAHILRRSAVLDHMRGVEPCRVLDVGCGAGTLLVDLARLGFTGTGVDQSTSAVETALRFHPRGDSRFQIASQISAHDTGSFDFLIATEVLEHIEDDADALARWLDCLAPGGRVLVSVPGHMSQWGPADEWAGHVRRYERDGLRELLAGRGLSEIAITSYGFPLLRMVQPLRDAACRRRIDERRNLDSDNSIDRTLASGVDRSEEARKFWIYGNRASRGLLWIFCRLQRFFYRTDIGIGYIATARKV